MDKILIPNMYTSTKEEWEVGIQFSAPRLFSFIDYSCFTVQTDDKQSLSFISRKFSLVLEKLRQCASHRKFLSETKIQTLPWDRFSLCWDAILENVLPCEDILLFLKINFLIRKYTFTHKQQQLKDFISFSATNV
jgi:hypothetical protein